MQMEFMAKQYLKILWKRFNLTVTVSAQSGTNLIVWEPPRNSTERVSLITFHIPLNKISLPSLSTPGGIWGNNDFSTIVSIGVVYIKF